MISRRLFMTAGLFIGIHPALSSAQAAALYDAATFPKIAATGTTVVHIHAAWCPVCRVQEPALASIEANPAFSKVRFIKVDFDRDRDFLKEFRVANQSIILILKNGKEVDRIAGVSEAKSLSDAIAKHL
jgi:thiol-disulfide isomerase/thioredoxin